MEEKELTLQEYLQEQRERLPQLVKRIIAEERYKEPTQQAITSAGLTVDDDKLESFYLEVLMVLVHLQSLEDFTAYLSSGKLCNAEKGAHVAERLKEGFFSSLVTEDESVPANEPYLLSHIQGNEMALKKYEAFPLNVKTLIQAIQKPEQIGTTYQLSPDKEEKLHEEIANVVVGVTTTDEFKEHIKDKLVISSLTAEKIYEHIEKLIFAPVKEGLVQTFEQNKEAEKKPEHDPYREPIE